MKMYILVKDSIPEGFAILAASHASLATYLKYQEEPEIKDLLEKLPQLNRIDICK